MRTVLLFLVLVIALLVAYILIPTEQMQLKAKNTIREVQSLDTSVDFGTAVDTLSDFFEKQKNTPQEEGAVDESVPSAAGVLSADRYTVCTDDAMLCPDGSVVGRIGPDCVFAPCPEAGLLEAQGEEGGAALLR